MNKGNTDSKEKSYNSYITGIHIITSLIGHAALFSAVMEVGLSRNDLHGNLIYIIIVSVIPFAPIVYDYIECRKKRNENVSLNKIRHFIDLLLGLPLWIFVLNECSFRHHKTSETIILVLMIAVEGLFILERLIVAIWLFNNKGYTR